MSDKQDDFAAAACRLLLGLGSLLIAIGAPLLGVSAKQVDKGECGYVWTCCILCALEPVIKKVLLLNWLRIYAANMPTQLPTQR